MILWNTLTWILKCVFTCNHTHTFPREGKCYCPDCGRGVIFQWVVMRCEACNYRAESHITLRQLTPSQRCCNNCGQQSFFYDYLESPSYFQLNKARLVIREEDEYLQERSHWSVYAFNDTWSILNTLREQTLSQGFMHLYQHMRQQATRALIAQKPCYIPALISTQSSTV